MRRSAAPPWADLALVVALMLVGLLVTVAPAVDWVRAVVLSPLALALPGYALTAALFLPGEISRDLRVVLTVAFSVSTWALGGLALQLAVDLDRSVFAALLAAVTTSAVIVALIRREVLPSEDDRNKVGLPRVGVTSALAILASAALAGWAIAIATSGQHRQLDRAQFSSLWLVPQDRLDVPRSGLPVEIGVSNHEGRPVAYRLDVRRGAKTVAHWQFRLGTDRDWRATLTASAVFGPDPLVGSLYCDGSPCRRVAIKLGASV